MQFDLTEVLSIGQHWFDMFLPLHKKWTDVQKGDDRSDLNDFSPSPIHILNLFKNLRYLKLYINHYSPHSCMELNSVNFYTQGGHHTLLMIT